MRELLRLSRFEWFVFVGLLAFNLTSKLYQLADPPNYYFDEVYHGFTAQEMVKGNPQVYDPWAKSPKGKAFEWTHPPLGKLIIAGSILTFGDSWFSMRLSSVVFGVGSIVLSFLLCMALFQSANAGLITMFLLTVDGLFFTHCRIAMIDMHFLFFDLCALLCFGMWLRKIFEAEQTPLSRKKKKRKLQLAASKFDIPGMKLILATAIFAGLAAATKWTAFYLLAFLIGTLVCSAIFDKRLRKWPIVSAWVICLGLIPPVLYLISYAQYFWFGFSWDQFVELQKQMWWYHTHLKATHNYSSRPIQWILDLKPVWLYVRYEKGGVGNIYDNGNPILFFGGLISIAILGWEYYKQRRWQLLFLISAYLIFWVPWVASPRIMFFYHYIPSLPFLAMAFAVLLARWLQAKADWSLGFLRLRTIAQCLITAAVLWFTVFYPNLTGIVVPTPVAERLYGDTHPHGN